MSLTITEAVLDNGVRQFKLEGVLDSSEANARGEEHRETIVDDGGTVLMDLSELTFLSSGGMRVLMLIAKDLDAAGGVLHLAAPQPRVMSVLTISGFVPAFPVHQTLEEAHAVLLD